MPVLRIELMRPTRREYLAADDLYETAWEECARETFAKAWAEEEEQARNHVDTETIRLATGLLLPIWSALPSTHLAVSRIVDAEGRSWLGRIVFPGDLHQLFGKLGLSEETSLTPSEIARAVENGNVIPLKRPFACEIKRARVNGLPRIEIVGAPASQLAWLKSLGCFTEVIAYKTRVFVPVPEATAILQRVLGDR